MNCQKDFDVWYNEVREKYIEHQYDQAKELDKMLFTLSSGFFGVSFAFYSQVVKTPNPQFAWKVLLAWIFTLASIISSILSYLVVYYNYDEEIKRVDKIKYQRENGGLEIKTKNKFKGIPEFLNILTIILLILGFGFMIVYIANHLLEA